MFLFLFVQQPPGSVAQGISLPSPPQNSLNSVLAAMRRVTSGRHTATALLLGKVPLTERATVARTCRRGKIKTTRGSVYTRGRQKLPEIDSRPHIYSYVLRYQERNLFTRWDGDETNGKASWLKFHSNSDKKIITIFRQCTPKAD